MDFHCSSLLPHGIFEIPAFIISGALGILLAQSLIAEWYGGGIQQGRHRNWPGYLSSMSCHSSLSQHVSRLLLRR